MYFRLKLMRPLWIRRNGIILQTQAARLATKIPPPPPPTSGSSAALDEIELPEKPLEAIVDIDIDDELYADLRPSYWEKRRPAEEDFLAEEKAQPKKEGVEESTKAKEIEKILSSIHSIDDPDKKSPQKFECLEDISLLLAIFRNPARHFWRKNPRQSLMESINCWNFLTRMRR